MKKHKLIINKTIDNYLNVIMTIRIKEYMDIS